MINSSSSVKIDDFIYLHVEVCKCIKTNLVCEVMPFYPPRSWGHGVIASLGHQSLPTRDFFHMAHTHRLGGVYVPFKVDNTSFTFAR